jgi:Photosynthetic reaction centre cytochrome C subunit
MKKTWIITTCFVALVCMSFAVTKDEPLYKNLKVLPKRTTKAEMDSVMKHFTVSLGVKCNFCHVRTADNKEWDFPSDGNKHKLVAREMMKMTSKINKKYFDVTENKGVQTALMVSCYTCHNGKAEPAVNPAPAQKAQP